VYYWGDGKSQNAIFQLAACITKWGPFLQNSKDSFPCVTWLSALKKKSLYLGGKVINWTPQYVSSNPQEWICFIFAIRAAECSSNMWGGWRQICTSRYHILIGIAVYAMKLWNRLQDRFSLIGNFKKYSCSWKLFSENWRHRVNVIQGRYAWVLLSVQLLFFFFLNSLVKYGNV
jgi:hypothetical protein